MSLAEISATTLLAGFPEPMLVFQPSGTLVFANEAALGLLELESAEGRNITEFLPEHERQRLDPLEWMQRWAHTPDAPEIEHVHLECQTQKGAVKPVRVRVGRLTDEDQSLYVVMMHDITELQARQQQTRQAHRLAARVLEISSDAIITANRDLIITYTNSSAEKLFGYASGELNNKPLDVLIPRENRDGHAQHVSDFASGSHPARLMGERGEIAGLSKTGEIIPLEASITKVTLEQDVAFSAHLRDLRPRKTAESELARSTASFETVFNHALQAMALIDTRGTVQQMNAAARGLLEEDADPVGQPFTALPFFSRDPQAMADQLQSAIERCLQGEIVRLPVNIQFPDGTLRNLDFSLSPVADGDDVFAMIAEARVLLDSNEPDRA